MMPLWTTTIRPVQSRCGWAFSSVGRPCVAHRVWPIPYSPSSGLPAMTSSSRASLPALRLQLDVAVADDRDPGRVVAAVLEPAQAVDQNRKQLLAADVSNNSAHESNPFNPIASSCSARPSLLCWSAGRARWPASRRGRPR